MDFPHEVHEEMWENDQMHNRLTFRTTVYSMVNNAFGARETTGSIDPAVIEFSGFMTCHEAILMTCRLGV